MTCNNLREAIDTIQRSGFNVFESPRFMEWYLSKAIGAEMLEFNAPADLMTDQGLMLEVKVSRPVRHYKGGETEPIYRYKWQGLLGHTKRDLKDGNVDVYILVGVQDDFNEYWILPALTIQKHTAHAHPQQTRTHPSWMDTYYFGTDIQNVINFFNDLTDGGHPWLEE